MDVEELEGRLLHEWERICWDEETKGFAGLPRRDQVFHDIWMLEAELNNGGFSQYMFNTTGDRGLPAVEALREVGAPSLANVCERLFALLSTGAPAADQDSRQAQLDQAAERIGEDAFEDACSALEAEFYAGEDELRRLLVAYVDTGRGSQLVAIRKFIEHAKEVVPQIEAYEESSATDIPARDLSWAKERLANMVKSAESGTMPPVESRYGELSRVIIDQWPLGHSLGNSISAVESEYIAL